MSPSGWKCAGGRIWPIHMAYDSGSTALVACVGLAVFDLTQGAFGSSWSATIGAAAVAGIAYVAVESMFGNLPVTGPTGHNLTTSWTIGAGIEHYWTPALRSSISGNYNQTTFNGTAQTLFCASPQSPIRNAAGAVADVSGVGGVPLGTVAIAGCNPNFTAWNIGTRTIWNPVPILDFGIEIMYT